MGTALAGSDRSFVLATGMVGLALPGRHRGRRARRNCPDASRPCRVEGGDSPAGPLLAGHWCALVRGAAPAYGDGDHGFTRTIAEPARERRVAAYGGEGTIRWSPVHRADAARLARLALESAPAGSVLHAAAAVAQLRHISEIMARHLEVPTPSVLPVEALEYFGHLATSSASTALGRRHPRPRRSTGDLPVRTCSRILRQSTAPNARAERCPHSPPRANGRRPARHRCSRRYGAPARGALPCTTRSRCPASAARQHRRDRAAGASQGRSRCSGV